MIYADTTSTQTVPTPEGHSGEYYNTFLISDASDALPTKGSDVSNLADDIHFAPGSVYISSGTRKVYLKASPDDTTNAWMYVGTLKAEEG